MRSSFPVGGLLAILSVVLIIAAGAVLMMGEDRTYQALGSLVVVGGILWFITLMVAIQKLPPRR